MPGRASRQRRRRLPSAVEVAPGALHQGHHRQGDQRDRTDDDRRAESDRAGTERRLDEPVRQLHQRREHDGPKRPDQRPGQRHSADRQHVQHRDVPQVDAVAATSDADEHRVREQPLRPARRRDQRRDAERGCPRRSEEPPRIHPRIERPGGEAQRREHPRRHHHRRRPPPRRQVASDERDRSAGEQLERPRIGARIGVGGIDEGHRGDRCGPENEDRAEPNRRASNPAKQPDQHQRPDEVELLLDGQRPQVVEQGAVIELPVARQAEPPIRPVRGPRERTDRIDHPAEACRIGRPRRDRAHRDQHDHGGHEPSDSSRPESPQVDAAEHAARWRVEAGRGDGGPRPTSVLHAQHPGDQVARQHEEHVDADEPAREQRGPRVERNHGRDGERSDAVERRPVAPDRRIEFGRSHAVRLTRPTARRSPGRATPPAPRRGARGRVSPRRRAPPRSRSAGSSPIDGARHRAR